MQGGVGKQEAIATRTVLIAVPIPVRIVLRIAAHIVTRTSVLIGVRKIAVNSAPGHAAIFDLTHALTLDDCSGLPVRTRQNGPGMKIARTARALQIEATGRHGRTSLGRDPVRLDSTAMQRSAVEARAPIVAMIGGQPANFAQHLLSRVDRSALAGSPPPQATSKAESDSRFARRMKNLNGARPARKSARTAPSSRAADRGQLPEDASRIPVSPESNVRNMIATGDRIRPHGRVLTEIAANVPAPIALNPAQESGRSARSVLIVQAPDLVPADSSAEAPAATAEAQVRIVVACALAAAVVQVQDPAANRAAANLAEANAAPEPWPQKTQPNSCMTCRNVL